MSSTPLPGGRTWSGGVPQKAVRGPDGKTYPSRAAAAAAAGIPESTMGYRCRRGAKGWRYYADQVEREPRDGASRPPQSPSTIKSSRGDSA